MRGVPAGPTGLAARWRGAGSQPQLDLGAAEAGPVDLQCAAGGLGDPAGDVET